MQTFGDSEIGGCGWHSGEGFAVERVDRGGEVEVVGVAAAGDVDIRLGARRRRIDAAGRDVPCRPLDGVGGEGVGVVDADLGAPCGGAVVVEEAARDVDGSDAVEVDGE